MKRSILCNCIALLFVLTCTACSTPDETNPSSVEAAADYTIELKDPVDLQAKKIETSFIQGDAINNFDQFSDFADEAVATVRGNISNVEYFFHVNDPFTKMDLEVTDVISGTFKPGDKISVFKWGGYASLSDINPDIQDRFPDLTQEEIDNTVVDVSIEGDPHPTVGQDILVFLYEPHPDSPDVTGMYGIIGGYKGQFTNDGAGIFTRHIEWTPEGNETNGIVSYSLESQPEVDRSGMTGTDRAFTFDELKAEALAAIQ